MGRHFGMLKANDMVHVDVADDVPGMINMLHITGAYVYFDQYGAPVGVEDVFSKLEKAKKHYEEVCLGADYMKRFVR